MSNGDSMIVHRTKLVSSVGAFIGSIVLLAGIYSFIDRMLFLESSAPSLAKIISVSHEYVPKGKGSVLAYVPTVQINGIDGEALAVKVDTSNEEPVYKVGDEIYVSCNLQRECIEDSFLAKWS